MKQVATADEIAQILERIRKNELYILPSHITEFPEDFRFPDTLTVIGIHGSPEEPSRLTHLPPLPDSLKIFELQFAPDFKKVPELEHLPNLQTLYITHTNLKELPPLPSSLRNLFATENKLKSIPTLKNTSLRHLHITRNKIDTIPTLPPEIETINADSNDITVIPDLPESLRYIYLGLNPLEEPYKSYYKAYEQSRFNTIKELRMELQRMSAAKRIRNKLYRPILNHLHRPPNADDPEKKGGPMYRRGKESFNMHLQELLPGTRGGATRRASRAVARSFTALTHRKPSRVATRKAASREWAQRAASR